MAWWAGLFGRSDSPLTLSFCMVFNIFSFLHFGGEGGILTMMEGDGAGGGFSRPGGLVAGLVT